MKLGPIPVLAIALLLPGAACGQPPPSGGATRQSEIVPPPRAADWAAIAQLPDLSGTWLPDIGDQKRQERGNPLPWKPEIQKQVDHWFAEERAGRPFGVLVNCLPHGMPSLMMITHNALEFLVTPGRVTILGESEGNRLRRIWTDGRAMPDDPDPSFNGYSVGRWEGGKLIVETRAILPQTYLAVSEAVGIPSNGGMSVHETIQLIGPDTMAVDMDIAAPAILSKPWHTRRLYTRTRERAYEIVEGVCRQGDFHEATDQWGNAIYEPTTQDGLGNILPPAAQP